MIQSISWLMYSPSVSQKPDTGSKMDKGKIYSKFTRKTQFKQQNQILSHVLGTLPFFWQYSFPQKDLYVLMMNRTDKLNFLSSLFIRSLFMQCSGSCTE